MLVPTTYRLSDGRSVGTSVYCASAPHLEELLSARGMDEQVENWRGEHPPVMPSEHLAAGRLAASNHALVWASMIASRAKLTDAWDLLQDSGLIHRMAHLLEVEAEERANRAYRVFGDSFRPRSHAEASALLPHLERFERLVPGLHPCWEHIDVYPLPPRPLEGDAIPNSALRPRQFDLERSREELSVALVEERAREREEARRRIEYAQRLLQSELLRSPSASMLRGLVVPNG